MRPLYTGLVFLTVGLSLLAGACSGPAKRDLPPQKDITLQTSDGVSLTATVYPAEGANPPGLVLVHMLGATRDAWKSFAPRAQAAGYLCIAIDLRGHGGSRNASESSLNYKDFTTQDWLAAIEDIETARHAAAREGASLNDIAVVGASIGANLALRHALEYPEVPAVVMISPGLDYKGVTTEHEITEFGQRPCLLVTSEGDSYSDTSCATLKKAASGLCELRQYPGSAHGTNILDASPAAVDEILLWLDPILKGSQKPAPAQN